MLRHSNLLSNLLSRRSISTSSRMRFKFKLTDEMVREQEEKARNAPKKPEPEKALHTKESSLIMGRVSSDRYDKVIKVAIPKHRLNEHLLLYVRENDNIYALDEHNQCKPGDWILLRRQEKPIDEGVEHKVDRVVYYYGNYVDPITSRRSIGLYYDDDVRKLEEIKLDL